MGSEDVEAADGVSASATGAGGATANTMDAFAAVPADTVVEATVPDFDAKAADIVTAKTEAKMDESKIRKIQILNLISGILFIVGIIVGGYRSS